MSMQDDDTPIQDALPRVDEAEDSIEKPDVLEATESSWIHTRERLVEQALEEEDHEALARISALPGGFGSEEMRKRVWPILLRTEWFFRVVETGSRGETESKPDSATSNEVLEEAADTDEQTQESPVKETHEVASAAGTSPGPIPHPDEGQVLLDTKRSFVTYPKDLHPATKKAMQADLQELIVNVLRLYPTLGYFQGFHDIMSVLYLTFIPPPPLTAPRSRSTSRRRRNNSGTISPLSGTLTPASGLITPVEGEKHDTGENVSTTESQDANEKQRGRSTEAKEEKVDRDTSEWAVLRQCAAVVSLCRMRDAMGKGMEPMMGLLKILQRLLKVADPELYRFSSTISPVPTLPFFALSWILCLFSHDIDGLEPVQRMFDFLLARNPISAIYLAVAILIAKKDQLFVLAKQLGPEGDDDPSLLHPLFSRLPPLYPDTPDAATLPPATDFERPKESIDNEPNPYKPIPLSQVFKLTDDLLARYPWDGDVIHGEEIMGEGSVVFTYRLEESLETGGEWGLKAAESVTDKDVVRPGAAEPDAEEEEEEEVVPVKKLRNRIHGPRDRLGTVVAVGILAIGVGIAIYTGRSGARSGWAGWWRTVIKSWTGKGGVDVVDKWKTLGGFVGKLLGEVV